MRHLIVAAAMVIGALVVTSVASTALQSYATSRAQQSSYEPPALAASPVSYSKKTDGVLSGVQRTRPRVASNPDGRV